MTNPLTAEAESLGRPGGNVTEFIDFEASPGGKRLQLLKEEVAPGVTRAGLPLNPACRSQK
jgi:hypothetical protein